jgi:hypothetical protein
MQTGVSAGRQVPVLFIKKAAKQRLCTLDACKVF